MTLAIDDAVAAAVCPATMPDVVVNGKPHAIAEETTVAELLGALGLAQEHVAVERNREIVPRAEHGTCVLAAGDTLEIVTFVGGG